MKTVKDFISKAQELDEATKTWNRYGAEVSKLVDKYKAHETDNTSYRVGGNFSASSSGKIEFANHHQHHGGQYGISRVVHHAVKLGSNYPKDKAEEFKKDYAKVQAKHMPSTVRFSTDVGGFEDHNVQPFEKYGSNYSTLGVITHKQDPK